MEVLIKDFKTFMSKKFKAIASFSASSLYDPLLKIEANNKELILEVSINDRWCKVCVKDVEVIKEGIVYVKVFSLFNLKNLYKQAILKNEDDHLIIKSTSSNKSLTMKIKLADSSKFIEINKNLKNNEPMTLTLDTIKKTIARIIINPILNPSLEEALLTIVPKKNKMIFYINDASRIIMLEHKNSDIGIDKVISTTVKGFMEILNFIATFTDKANFHFDSKFIQVSTPNNKIGLKLFHNNSTGNNTYEKIKIITNRALKENPVMSFIPNRNNNLKDALSNAVSLVGSKSGFIDIRVNQNNNEVIIKSIGSDSNITEKVEVKKSQGDKEVRLQTNVLHDLSKKISEVCCFKINSNIIVVINKWEKDISTYFFLPILRFTENG